MGQADRRQETVSGRQTETVNSRQADGERQYSGRQTDSERELASARQAQSDGGRQ